MYSMMLSTSLFSMLQNMVKMQVVFIEISQLSVMN